MSCTHPFVSVLTPTYNRRKFIPALIKCIEHQTYPKDKMEWIVLDDGTDSVEDLFVGLKNVKYIRIDGEKMTIGAKRNMLQDMAKGEYLCWFDDDDYYMPDRISHAINMLRARGSKAPLLAGASELYMYVSSLKKIYTMMPLHPFHATNGTMVVHRNYAKKNKYDNSKVYAEEPDYLKGYTQPLIQLNPLKTMLVISHGDNTFDKTKIINQKVFRETTLRLKDIIKDKELRAFYESL